MHFVCAGGPLCRLCFVEVVNDNTDLVRIFFGHRQGCYAQGEDEHEQQGDDFLHVVILLSSLSSHIL